MVQCTFGNDVEIQWEGRPSLIGVFFNPAVLLSCIMIVGLFYYGLETGSEYFTIAACILIFFPVYVFLDRYCTRYGLTPERLLIIKGILFRRADEVELYRVRDVRLVRGPIQRLIGIGTIWLDSTDFTGLVLVKHVYNSETLREKLRTNAEEVKRKRGVRVFETN